MLEKVRLSFHTVGKCHLNEESFMNTVYNSSFFNEFYEENGGGNYTDKERWMPFFINIAEEIIKRYNPRTVLDAGCAMGYIVEALRDRGVEAYGFDISEYAINNVREDIKPYCFVHSVTEPLPDRYPQKYDMVLSIEVLEHLFHEDAMRAINNLCKYTDMFIFSSTSDDIADRTHVNVQQSEYWAKLFATNSFFCELSANMSFISPWAKLYMKKTDFSKVIHDYEMNLRIDKMESVRSQMNTGTIKVYYDDGKGFCEENSICSNIVDLNNVNYEFALPHSVSSIRIDPVEDTFCIVKNFKIETSLNESPIITMNGVHFGEFDLFNTNDSQYYINFKVNKINRFKVKASIFKENSVDREHFLQEIINSIKMLDDLSIELDDAKKEISNYQKNEKDYVDNEKKIKNLYQIITDLKKQLSYQLAQNQRIIGQSNVLRQQLSQMQANLMQNISDKEKDIAEYTQQIEQLQQHYHTAIDQREDLSRQLSHYQQHYHAAINQREDLTARVVHLQSMYDSISNSTCWRMTRPLRVVLDAIKTLLKKNTYTHLFCKGVKSLIKNGVRPTIVKVNTWKQVNKRDKELAILTDPYATKESVQKRTKFKKDIKFSILVPLYNTPEQFLREMIQSVQAQTYGNWELCLADGSDTFHVDVEKICKEYAKKDKRIKYKKLEQNLGISGNTNACIEMATGDYIALFDHDDLLHPAALFEVMKAICEKNADFIYTDENTFHTTPEDAYCPHYKPDFASDTLRSYNYICHFTVFKKDLLDITGGFRSEFDGSQDYDMILRLTEVAESIVHIPKILYFWRSHAGSVASEISAKPYTIVAAKKALAEHLERVGLKGTVEDANILSTYKINYEIDGQPLISILIPNKDHIAELKVCIDSIREKSTYTNWEIIIIENNSVEEITFAYYDELQKDSRIRVVYWDGKFNYSAINNYGLQFAKGEYVLLLNNDVEIISPDWLEQMLMFAQRSDVGAVGAMLYYPDDTIQHAGVILGIGGVAGHAHKYFKRGEYGYASRLQIAQNYSAVTAACVMIPRKVLDEVNGLDESFEVAFNDVDLCMRIRQAGYLIVWTPYAELYHYESKSRGLEDTPEKQQRFTGEVQRFQQRWGKELNAGDPYYNPNLTLDREDFSLKSY